MINFSSSLKISLSQNPWHSHNKQKDVTVAPMVNRVKTCTIESTLQFIHEICCSYQKNQSHMTRTMESTALSIFLGVYVKDMLKNRHLLAKFWIFYLDVIYCQCLKEVNQITLNHKPLQNLNDKSITLRKFSCFTISQENLKHKHFVIINACCI